MTRRTHLAILTLLFLLWPVYGLSAAQARVETAILAGGCFWCLEADYEKLDGVLEVVSGYTGGHLENPTYVQVSGGDSGHVESVRVRFDPAVISYAQILDFFWRHVDPTRDDGQFCDRGLQYRPVIFYQGKVQYREALASERRAAAAKPFPAPLKVELTAATRFYPAEEYHQDYYRKKPLRYKFYRYRCGRDARVEALWGEAD
ncbi:MAG TPA: peptide-methionine (S)-S-oxide reductase [Gammaproteobacteria bacterium]|nr:peptide-methionine (S)-S-oxide reductase [Gammaproteobacteria bacterium]